MKTFHNQNCQLAPHLPNTYRVLLREEVLNVTPSQQFYTELHFEGEFSVNLPKTAHSRVTFVYCGVTSCRGTEFMTLLTQPWPQSRALELCCGRPVHL